MNTQSERVPTLDRNINITNQWLDEIKNTALCADRNEAYSATRATLMTLRDRLTPEEAADLGAQLPTFIRGVYYEAYNPARTPTKQRSADDFLQSVREHMGPRAPVEPENAVRGTLKAIDHHITEGEISDIRNLMPEELREFWPHH